jgi:hypothetical protein
MKGEACAPRMTGGELLPNERATESLRARETQVGIWALAVLQLILFFSSFEKINYKTPSFAISLARWR